MDLLFTVLTGLGVVTARSLMLSSAIAPVKTLVCTLVSSPTRGETRVFTGATERPSHEPETACLFDR
jgi:hypothetical protein